MNQIKDINYFALDLELNKNANGEQKIIEVGIAIGSPVRPEQIKLYNWYIDPHEPIDKFITELTGITDETIEKNAVSHETVAIEIGNILTANNVFCNPVTWGGGDAPSLLAEFKERDINFPFFGRRIFDVKTLYVFDHMISGKNTNGGLKSALSENKMKFIGGMEHQAGADALNTLRLFFHYLQRERALSEHIEHIKKLK